MDDRPQRPGDPQGRPRRPAPPAGQGDRRRPVPDPGAASRGGGRPAPREQARPRPSERTRANAAAVTTKARTPEQPKLSAQEQGKRQATRVAKIVLAVSSATVLLASGVAYGMLGNLDGGLTKNDVIGKKQQGEIAADGATDILLVGNDSRVDAQGNPLPKQILQELRAGDNEGHLTDSLILIRIPNDGSKASAMSFPRDSYVDVPGHGKNKVNSAYAFGRNAALKQLRNSSKSKPEQERDANTEGSKVLIKTLENLSGVEIDHYAEVNLLGFYEITKAVGGVDVCLTKATKEEKSGANFKAGPQTISGGDALAFVRQRYGLPRGDLDRVVRQQVFMAGLAKKILSGGTLTDTTKLSNLFEALKKSIVLDKDWDVIAFAQQMQGMAGGRISFETMPLGESIKTSDGQDAFSVNPSKVKDFAKQLITGGPAATTSTQAGSGNNGGNDSAGAKVDVFNTTTTTGLATKVQDALAAKGFAKGKSDNAPARPKTVVRYAKGEKSLADKVSEALGGVPVEENAKVVAGTVEVYLGKDYKGPGARGFTARGPVSLDGVDSVAPAAAPGQQPITADGVTCVN
ncbi:MULTISPECIES: LCP family protein [unclassified Crossiella]|uniref:LCP family protein n=1 Tax=unclassified Crossiella TaxID=2620835 RepID=UPI001FFEA300|nr:MULTISPECIES: LCP family protein [unclassified Crossiella]MCK2238417.1 LCP family protein [Crossiella sp. S99.2]MCK2256457.1 LCP family protein [Crossiella sp. S99.1]